MYAAVGGDDELRQGDIIRDVVLPVGLDPTATDLFGPTGDPITVNDAGPLPADTVVMSLAMRTQVMILSQSCDVENKPFLAVARVRPLSDVEPTFAAKGEPARAKFIKDNYQRSGIQLSRFYLQERPNDFPRSIASFLEIGTLQNSAAIREYMRSRRILRLTDEALADLQFRLSLFFGRYATSDNYMLTPAERAVLPGE